MDRVRFAYRKSHSWVNLELANLSQKDAQAINTLCRQLYRMAHTFLRYHYQKPELEKSMSADLTTDLQTAHSMLDNFLPPIEGDAGVSILPSMNWDFFQTPGLGPTTTKFNDETLAPNARRRN
ncbi:hypothetical protein [Candidatus Aalborgicola defluviihabitans]|uniref:hypothetical protein n=1 Tax=Candidatus Aalborgicola defluviihabitans TaxID=3386187 RepID=UPI001D3072D6|nr:hypothetical protein [Burkholderiales bacterium]